mmetsp:Transcript_8072/g.9284  ORF Transcript_8072/g.9284 Transcript_8072/m.9284 type:complete len:113 (+) Transcript_8072:19-357(+)
MCKRRTYNVLSAGLFASFGITMIVLSLSFKEFASNRLEYLNQIAEDWQKQPFVSLDVVRNYTCPEDTEEVIFKPWWGSKHMCACLSLWWNVFEGTCPIDDVGNRHSSSRSSE